MRKHRKDGVAMTNTEKAAYLRGLVEGLELDPEKKETKIIHAMTELLEDMALSLKELEDVYEDLSEQVDEVDEDLGTLEEDYYGDGAEEGCCGCGGEDDECYYEVTCPNCQETICLSEDMVLAGSLDCPNCGETLEFDIDDVVEDEAPTKEKETD